MNHEARLKLQIGMWRAFLMTLEFVEQASFYTKDGVWFYEKLACHPVEAVLMGESSSGDWNVDVAQQLGVTQEWIRGFIDGYAGKAIDDYNSGLIDGTTVKLHQERLPFIFFEFDADEFN